MAKVFTLLNRITITRRITVGFGLLILLIAVLGFLSWAALEKVSGNLRQVKLIAATSTAAAQLDLALTGLWPKIDAAILSEGAAVPALLYDGSRRIAGFDTALVPAYREYSDSVRQTLAVSDKLAAVRAEMPAVEAVFSPAIKAIADHRKLIFDAEGVAAITDLSMRLDDGIKQSLTLAELAGAGLTRSAADQLPSRSAQFPASLLTSPPLPPPSPARWRSDRPRRARLANRRAMPPPGQKASRARWSVSARGST